jgi:ankyrin repeat protein
MELIEAATHGNLKEIKKSLKETKDVDFCKSDFPALHYAMRMYPHIKKDVLKCVKLLIAAGADPNKEYINKETPFATACIEGHFKVVKFLFDKKKTNLNIRLANGNSLIEEIVIKCKNRPRNYTITQTVNGKKITTSDPDEIRKLGHGHPDDEYKAYQNIVKFLLKSSYKVDTLNPNKQSDLFTAIGSDCEEIVEILLKNGASTKLKDKWELTPLHYACRHGYNTMVKGLIAKGADVNAADQWGFTPAHEAIMSKHLGTTKMLFEAKANFQIGLKIDFDKDNPKGTTAQDIAEKNNLLKIVELIKVFPSLKFKKVPYKDWTWNKTKFRYDGVQIQDGKKLLWFTHTEHHQGGGAKEQSFEEFFHKGSNAITPPPEIEKEIRAFLKSYMHGN